MKTIFQSPIELHCKAKTAMTAIQMADNSTMHLSTLKKTLPSICFDPPLVQPSNPQFNAVCNTINHKTTPCILRLHYCESHWNRNASINLRVHRCCSTFLKLHSFSHIFQISGLVERTVSCNCSLFVARNTMVQGLVSYTAWNSAHTHKNTTPQLHVPCNFYKNHKHLHD